MVTVEGQAARCRMANKPIDHDVFLRQVLELRESRLDHEETLAEVQKATDEHKRNLDRQVSRRQRCRNQV